MPAARSVDRNVVVSAATAAVGGLLFACLAHEVTAHEGLVRADARILHDFVAHRSAALTRLAKVVTTLGTSPVTYFVVAMCGVLAPATSRRWRPTALAAAVLLSGQLVRLAINNAIARPRPPHRLWLMDAGGHAFPSGHTTTATLAYTVAAVLLVQRWPKCRIACYSLAALLAVAVGLSRVYLGVHWPTDVLGGWLFAISWLAVCALMWRSIPALFHRRQA